MTLGFALPEPLAQLQRRIRDFATRGELALHASSRAKVMVSEVVCRVANRCVRVLGGQGLAGAR